MTNKPTVTIGIPAYNEEANIGFLLEDLLAQKNGHYKLEKIIVSSDGSTDKTVKIVKCFANEKIEIIANRSRKGVAKRQNQIIKRTNSDILILLNADILIKDRQFIKKIIAPIVNGRADLTSAAIEEIEPKRLMEKILKVSMDLKRSVFENYRLVNNLYTCHGPARAFSKRLYQNFAFISSIGEDAYSYLYCVYNNFKYQYVGKAKVYYKLPGNFSDHEWQSLRYYASKEKFIKIFGEDFIKKSYYLPSSLFLKAFCLSLIKKPLYTFLYTTVVLFTKLNISQTKNISETWRITSSKKLRMKTETKKHIDVIEKYFYPVTAGIEVNTLETYSVLVEKGWEVIVHASKDSLTEKNVFSDYEVIREIKVKRYPFKWYGFLPKINWRETDVVALHNFDIFPHFLILVYCLMLRLLKKKRFALILTPHGGFSLDKVWHLYPRWQKVIKKAYHHSLASWLINQSVDGVRAVSEWEKQQMLAIGVNPKKVVVISNGLEDEAYMDIEKLASREIKARVRQWGKYLIRIGRIYPIKNDETIIRALSKVPEDIKLVIVGPIERNKFPQYIDFLNRLIDELKLKERVIFAGVIRGIDKYYAIKKSQTMVHMALWESFCNVVHEALSQGLVPIVANNTALPFLIKDNVNGYLINTHDHQSLSRKINYLIKNKDSKKHLKMSRKNIEFGKEHAWRRVAEKMEVFYETNNKRNN